MCKIGVANHQTRAWSGSPGSPGDLGRLSAGAPPCTHSQQSSYWEELKNKHLQGQKKRPPFPGARARAPAPGERGAVRLDQFAAGRGSKRA